MALSTSTSQTAHMNRFELITLASYWALAFGCGYLCLNTSLATPAWALVLLWVLTTATFVWLRQRTALLLVAMLALLVCSFAFGSGAEALLTLVALYRFGVAHTAQRAVLALGLSTVGLAAATSVLTLRTRFGPPILGIELRASFDGWAQEWLGLFLFLVAFALIATLLGLLVRHRRNEVQTLVEQAEQLRRERDQVALIAASTERERIAREIHDVIAHSLAVMIAVADGADAVAETQPAESRHAIRTVAATGRRTLTEMRRLLTAVGSPEFAATSGTPSIKQIPDLIAEFRAAGLPIRCEISGSPEPDAVVALTIYRVVQESLTNVLRHAREVQDVLVSLRFSGATITVLVEDTAAPVTEPCEAGRGLVGIRERGAFYNGTVEAGPRAGGGWRVFVQLECAI